MLALMMFTAASAAAAPHRPAAPPAPPALPAGSPPTLRVGTLTLARCPAAPAYCGALPRPLDPAGQVPGTIPIAFEWYPHAQEGAAAGVIVAVEGGPGYPSTGSARDYVALFAPLLDTHDLLLVDNRGTGRSQAIDCEPLQHDGNGTLAAVADCGAALGASADLYGSGTAADDLAAVLAALGTGRINLYGDSYGSFFAQAFAGRHGGLLRALILDSTWPVVGESPWYPEAAPAARAALDATCSQNASCARLAGSASGRVAALRAALEAHPFTGTAPDGNGREVAVRADGESLAYEVYSNATDLVLYRELDPAARAYLEDGDRAPLLRLLAENESASLSNCDHGEPRCYSAGLFVAVSCTDYPQLYDMTAPVAARPAEELASILAEERADPAVYAPFSIRNFRAMPLPSSVLDLCLDWPVPSPLHPPGEPVPPGTRFPDVPVLVMSGLLDTLTPAAQAAAAAALFPNATQILFANSFHVEAEGDMYACASVIAVNFFRDLAPGDTSCAAAIPAVRMVPRFARTLAALAPAVAGAGNEGDAADLRAVAAAVLTAGDALARWWVNYSGSDVGLRGGSFRIAQSGNEVTFTLDGDRWVEDLAVSGTVTWESVVPGRTSAALSFVAPGGAGTLDVRWSALAPDAQASVVGSIGGRAIVATMPAP
jgi:pimeloyl-ACP methyl ester carboxylesterase